MKNSTSVSEEGVPVYAASYQLQVKRRSDKLINYFLPCYFLIGFVFAQFYDTWEISIGVGSICLIAYYSVKVALPGSNLYQYVLSVVFGIFMAQYIYQMHGQFEMHFFAFIGSAILITYQNWKLQIPMLVVVVVHHTIFGYLQNSGVESIFFTQLDYFELQAFITHFVLAAVIFFVCGLWAYQLKKASLMLVNQTAEMGRLQALSVIALNKEKQEAALEKSRHELAESNLKFKYAVQATSDAIWDRRYSENTISWGEGFTTLFGYDITPETVSVLFWKSKVHPDDLDRVSKTIKRAKDNINTKTWAAEYRFLKANGDYAFVTEKAIILRDENGVACRTIGAVQDITEIKQSEIIFKDLSKKLAQEKYLLDTLMENMPDTIYFKDKESKIIRASKFMATKFGLTVDEIIGKSDFDLHSQAHALKAYKDEQNIQQTRQAKIDYVEMIQKNGEEQLLSSTKMPLINQDGEVIGTFGMSRDVTKVRKLEKEQHDAQLEKAVAQGKFEIASDVMHDIGNAVVGFGSYLNRIRRLQNEDSPDNLKNLACYFDRKKTEMVTLFGEVKATAIIKMLQSMGAAQRNTQEEITKSIIEQLNIITHIQEILDIQRQFISGHESQERKPVHLRNVINDSLAMLLSSTEKLGIDVSLDIPTDLPLIKGDRTKLMQAILNILKNSIDSIHDNSPAKTISISAISKEGKLLVEVKDSGIGFDKSTAEQLFKRGFTTKATCSGMGLHNTRKIVECHGGTIDVTSEGKQKGSLAVIGLKI